MDKSSETLFNNGEKIEDLSSSDLDISIGLLTVRTISSPLPLFSSDHFSVCSAFDFSSKVKAFSVKASRYYHWPPIPHPI